VILRSCVATSRAVQRAGCTTARRCVFVHGRLAAAIALQRRRCRSGASFNSAPFATACACDLAFACALPCAPSRVLLRASVHDLQGLRRVRSKHVFTA